MVNILNKLYTSNEDLAHLLRCLVGFIHTEARLALTSLVPSIQGYYMYIAGLAASTRKVHLSGKKQYILFCKDHKITQALPVNEEILCYYVAYLGDKGLAFGTIKYYLAALRDLHIQYGFPSPTDTKMPRLDRILKGIEVTRGKQGKCPKRKSPITPYILRQLRVVWGMTPHAYEHALLWAVAVTCFLG